MFAAADPAVSAAPPDSRVSVSGKVHLPRSAPTGGVEVDDLTVPVDDIHRMSTAATSRIRQQFADAHHTVTQRATQFQADVDALCARLEDDQ